MLCKRGGGNADDEQTPNKKEIPPPDWIKDQRDSSNIPRGDTLVANQLIRAAHLDTETKAESISDASSLFIPTGALEQLPPFARWYWASNRK